MACAAMQVCGHAPELGRGGLGRVVSAVDTVLGREVAVKEMLEGARSPELLERFLREGEVAGRLLQPNIVPVFDVGVREEGGRKTPYFAMGKIEGRDLGEILRSVEKGEGTARHDFSRPCLWAYQAENLLSPLSPACGRSTIVA